MELSVSILDHSIFFYKILYLVKANRLCSSHSGHFSNMLAVFNKNHYLSNLIGLAKAEIQRSNSSTKKAKEKDRLNNNKKKQTPKYLWIAKSFAIQYTPKTR
ncbi:hypothetical protein BY458DRAFT_201582 [Sporodiniella umbellata]|nr:hypothetical protein BY458DRAFT_201582 [Sporodiniella umbellata]